jgi:antitoxin VapB
MTAAKLFMNGGSQAVRLPKEFNFPSEMSSVHIHRCGNKIILEPTKYPWANLKKGVDMLPDDIDLERSPPDYSKKEDLF